MRQDKISDVIKNFFRKGNGQVTNETEQQEAEITDNGTTEETQENTTTPRQEETAPQNAAREMELTSKLMRLQADFDNFRKRSLAARADARDEARKEILLDLLPVYDNFLRAMDHADEMEDYSALRTGIEGILQQMREVFKRHGCTEINAAAGTQFDPNLHEATGMLQGNDDQANTIAQELVKGFLLNGNVMRPAQVIVYSAGN